LHPEPGINDAGQIVGTTNDRHGFLLSGGIFTNFDVPSANPGIGTIARGINDAGQIVGLYEGALVVRG
jgi:hypothetical protein